MGRMSSPAHPDPSAQDAPEQPTRSSSIAPSPVADVPEVHAEPPVLDEDGVAHPPKKSPYAKPKTSSPVRNATWALVITFGAVVIVAVLFFGVGRDVDREIPANSQLDLSESAHRAQEAASFAVAAPSLPDGWTTRSAKYDGAGDHPTWNASFTAPSGSLVTMVEAKEVGAPLLSSTVPDATVQDTVEVAGTSCDQLRSEGAHARTALSCDGDGWGLIVHSTGDPKDVQAVAEAAITSLEDGGAKG
jgi:hypothetical protein